MVTRLRVIVMATGLALVVAVAPPSVAFAASYTIAMRNFQFVPSPLHVKVGDYVTWINYDAADGQVAPASGGFTKSPILKPGQRYTARIVKAGTLGYYDTFNTFMKGTLIVAYAPLPTATPRPTVAPTPRPTVKATAKPTAKATAAPTKAGASSSAAGASASGASSPSDSSGAAAGATTSPSALTAATTTDSASSAGDLGVILLGLVLVALAFLAGMYAMRRRDRLPTDRL